MIGAPIAVLYACALAALLGFAAWRDIATREIPDGVSIALVVVGAAARLDAGWSALGISVLLAVLLFVFLLPLCSRGLLGGADLKLLAALAVGLAPLECLSLLADVTLVGGVLAAIYLALGKLLPKLCLSRTAGSRARPLWRRIADIEVWRIRRRASLPYGIAIAIGAAFVVLRKQGV